MKPELENALDYITSNRLYHAHVIKIILFCHAQLKWDYLPQSHKSQAHIYQAPKEFNFNQKVRT